MKKSKGKKPVHVTDDELEYDSNSKEREEHKPDELNVKGANLHFTLQKFLRLYKKVCDLIYSPLFKTNKY